MNNFNFTAFYMRYTAAIEKSLNTDLRIPILKQACELLNRFEDHLLNEAVNNWVEKFSLSKKLLTSFVLQQESPELSPSEELREFLLTYEIKQNEITQEIFINKNNKQISKEELELTIDNESYSLKHFNKFMNAQNKNISVIKMFNPLQDYFRELAENYKGEKLISELASCIPANNFEDKEDTNHYQKRLEYYLRKWLYKAVGQTLDIVKNDAMLLWIEPLGGSGKSYINRWFFSLPEFNKYYLRIGENAPFMDMAGISRGKFAIDWDELQLSKKRYLMFKSSIAATEVQAYSKKTKNYETFNRQVNFIGSTNKANRDRQKGFLLDDDDAIKRRIIPIDLNGRINYQKYTKDIDLKQLWGEAAAGILQAQKTNNKKILSWECDWADLREQNSRYVNANDGVDRNTILTKIKPAQKGSGVLMSASEILKMLDDKGIRNKLTSVKLGRFLANKGYEKGRVSNNRGYWVNIQ